MKEQSIKSVEDLILTSMNQNFVPIIDDNQIFISIIWRKDFIAYCCDKFRQAESEREEMSVGE